MPETQTLGDGLLVFIGGLDAFGDVFVRLEQRSVRVQPLHGVVDYHLDGHLVLAFAQLHFLGGKAHGLAGLGDVLDGGLVVHEDLHGLIRGESVDGLLGLDDGQGALIAHGIDSKHVFSSIL